MGRPIGHLNQRDANGRCTLVPDPRARLPGARAVGWSKRPSCSGLRCTTSGPALTSDQKGRPTYLICRVPADASRKLFVPEEEELG